MARFSEFSDFGSLGTKVPKVPLFAVSAALLNPPHPPPWHFLKKLPGPHHADAPGTTPHDGSNAARKAAARPPK